ncbi:MAG: NADH-quinone oxidoreductase subunit J [Bradymonadia bacterium]|jgi:NADH-quinone oxidoreductase subunit J
MAEEIFFFVFAFGAVLSSIGVVTFRNPINCAISMVVSFFFLSGLYVQLNAHFLAMIQVLVYAGAIMVLFMFVLMLLNMREVDYKRPRVTVTNVVGVAGVAATFVVLASAIVGDFSTGTQLFTETVSENFGKIAPIGEALVLDYVLAFEMAAVLLLVGIVGAVVVAKRRI